MELNVNDSKEVGGHLIAISDDIFIDRLKFRGRWAYGVEEDN